MRLQDKVAIITGAARSIGRAIAEGYARAGAAVIINDLREADAAAVAEAINEAGGRADSCAADVSDLAQHDKLIDAAVRKFGRLDILVNNAGIEMRAPFLELTPENFDRTLAVNLRAPFFLGQRAARAMLGFGGGRIIHVESTRNTVPLRHAASYNVSKGGLMMLVRSMALELAEHGITVNGLAPGAIFTDINRGVLANETYRAQLEARIPVGRIGQPADLVGAAIFLASAEAAYVNGTTLYVDGGLLLR